MNRGRMFVRGLALAAMGLGLAGQAVRAQVIQRDTKVTGPRGRSIERDVRIQRGPGYVDRDIRIQRPGGTFERDTRIVRRGPVPGAGPAFGGYGPRGVIVENFYAPPPPVGLFGFGFGGPALNLNFGTGPLFGPPPVVVAPPPVVVAPPPEVVVQPPVRYAPPSTIVVDPVAQAIARLSSFHNHSRRDGALTLGRLGDNRAVPALVERLDKDHDKEVRQAAAWALGEIGDPKASLSLQKASLYDHKQDVRDVAAIAYKKLGRAPAPTAATTPATTVIRSTPTTTAPDPTFDPAQAGGSGMPPVGSGSPPPPPMPEPLGDLPPVDLPK